MFWFTTIRDLKNRLKEIEILMKQERIKKNCADGNHEWEQRDAQTKNPFSRCIHCWKTPGQK
jgi:hypothetical protein